MTSEFNGELKPAELDALWSHFSRLQFGWASAELQVWAVAALRCCLFGLPIPAISIA